MFGMFIKITLKSALGNPKIKERIDEAVKNGKYQVRGKIIDLDEHNYKVVGE